MSYIGNEPVVSATRTLTEITATAGQTVFTANGGYTVGYVDVIRNGSQLNSADYTATNGTTITLANPAFVNDEIKIVAWGTFSSANALTVNNPSYTGTLTGGTGVVNLGSGQFYKDASGNVGIGTASPAAKLDVTGSVNSLQARFGNVVNRGLEISTFTAVGTNDAGSILNARGASSGTMVFQTDSTERMRIDSSGNLLVGTTSAAPSGGGRLVVKGQGATATWNYGGQNNGGDSFVVFNASSTGVYITNGGVAWIATSDERLKTSLKPFEGAIDKISTIRSGTGRYLTDDDSVSRSFLIAQDVLKVLPEAVDIQNDENKTLGLRYTDLIPLLVKAIQELNAKVDAQAAEIAALKNPTNGQVV
jgi:hypothetical protein